MKDRKSPEKENGQQPLVLVISRYADAIYRLFYCYCFIKANVPALTEAVKHLLEGNYLT